MNTVSFHNEISLLYISGNGALEVLAQRTGDKVAQDFVKLRSKVQEQSS